MLRIIFNNCGGKNLLGDVKIQIFKILKSSSKMRDESFNRFWSQFSATKGIFFNFSEEGRKFTFSDWDSSKSKEDHFVLIFS